MEIPNYLEVDRTQCVALTDPNCDFYLKSQATYKGESEFHGLLFLQIDRLVWRSLPQLNMNNIKNLKKLDSELWEDEIEGIEK